MSSNSLVEFQVNGLANLGEGVKVPYWLNTGADDKCSVISRNLLEKLMEAKLVMIRRNIHHYLLGKLTFTFLFD